MNPAADTGAIDAIDPRGVSRLRTLSRANDPAALKAAAQQFEALFLQMVLKSMREATPREGLFDSEQSRMYESMLDQQLTQALASRRGTGLAEMIERQLQRSADPQADFPDGLPLNAPARSFLLQSLNAHRAELTASAPATGTSRSSPEPAPPPVGAGEAPVPEHVRAFVNRFLPDATQASASTGIPPAFLIAHAALESGWGRSEPRFADGRPSHNLFGIKAGQQWAGERLTVRTTEVIAGMAQRRDESFRAYGSYGEAFADHARLLADNPRYQAVLGARSADAFAEGLQRGGYATDPNYASKLKQVIASLPS